MPRTVPQLEKRNEDFDMICRGLHPTHDVFGDASKAAEDSPSPQRIEVWEAVGRERETENEGTRLIGTS